MDVKDLKEILSEYDNDTKIGILDENEITYEIGFIDFTYGKEKYKEVFILKGFKTKK